MGYYLQLFYTQSPQGDLELNIYTQMNVTY